MSEVCEADTTNTGVTIYAPTIFGIAGLSPAKRQWISGLNNIFYMFSTLICVFTLDKIGRRWTCYWGSVGQGIAMALAGAFSYLGQQATKDGDMHKASSYGNAAVAMVFIFTFVFGATWLTVPWLYPAEIFPLEIRAKGNAWGVVGWSIGNGWLTLLCPVMFKQLGEKTPTSSLLATLSRSQWSGHYTLRPKIVRSKVSCTVCYKASQLTQVKEIDLLFASDSIWNWEAEKNFARLQEDVGQVQGRRRSLVGGMKSHMESMKHDV